MQKNRARKRAAIAAAATAAIAPAAVPLVIPDTAAAAPGYCPGNALCLYRDPGFAGSVAWFRGNDNSYTDNTFVNGQALNDQVSSLWNNTDRAVSLCVNSVGVRCDGSGAGGNNLCLGPGSAVRNLGNPPNYDQRLSSHTFYSGSVFSVPSGCDVVVQGSGSYGCSM
jgi:hypothetical protein